MSITRMKGRTEMRWIPIGRKAFAEIFDSSTGVVTNDYDGTALYWHENGISAIRRMGDRLYMYERDFKSSAVIDVNELQPGDVIWHCLDDGPVKSHEPYCSFPETEELVSWESGMSDRFGKPQSLEVLR